MARVLRNPPNGGCHAHGLRSKAQNRPKLGILETAGPKVLETGWVRVSKFSSLSPGGSGFQSFGAWVGLGFKVLLPRWFRVLG